MQFVHPCPTGNPCLPDALDALPDALVGMKGLRALDLSDCGLDGGTLHRIVTAALGSSKKLASLAYVAPHAVLLGITLALYDFKAEGRGCSAHLFKPAAAAPTVYCCLPAVPCEPYSVSCRTPQHWWQRSNR